MDRIEAERMVETEGRVTSFLGDHTGTVTGWGPTPDHLSVRWDGAEFDQAEDFDSLFPQSS